MLNVENVRPQLLELFAPAEVERQRVLTLEANTDKDFLNSGGQVDKDLKKANKTEVGLAKGNFNSRVHDGLDKVTTTESITDDVDRFVVYESLDDRLSGFQKSPGYEFTPDNPETVVDFAISEVEKFQDIAKWWSNPAEFFAHFEENRFSLYVAKQVGRISVEGKLSRHGGTPSVMAKFDTGVTLSTYNGSLPHSPTEAQEFKRGLFGWDGYSHKRIKDFRGNDQDSFKFLDAETLSGLDSKQRFGLRMAQEALMETVEISPIDIPAPKYEFSDEMSQSIADAVVQELLGLEQESHKSRTGNSSPPFTWEVTDIETPITHLSTAEFYRLLRSADVPHDLLKTKIAESVGKLKDSGQLKDYFKAIKVELLADQFVEDFL